MIIKRIVESYIRLYYGVLYVYALFWVLYILDFEPPAPAWSRVLFPFCKAITRLLKPTI